MCVLQLHPCDLIMKLAHRNNRLVLCGSAAAEEREKKLGLYGSVYDLGWVPVYVRGVGCGGKAEVERTNGFLSLLPR